MDARLARAPFELSYTLLTMFLEVPVGSSPKSCKPVESHIAGDCRRNDIIFPASRASHGQHVESMLFDNIATDCIVLRLYQLAAANLLKTSKLLERPEDAAPGLFLQNSKIQRTQSIPLSSVRVGKRQLRPRTYWRYAAHSICLYLVQSMESAVGCHTSLFLSTTPRGRPVGSLGNMISLRRSGAHKKATRTFSAID